MRHREPFRSAHAGYKGRILDGQSDTWKAELIVNCIFDSMEQSLKQGERIEIRGFGSFEIRNYKAYEGRNPRTGETVQVKPKRLAFFKVGKELRERVNNGRQDHVAPEPATSC